jgi:hypothetical protein
MYTTILLAAALQHWERYSAHALAARAVAATLAKGTANHLHVLSVYQQFPPMAPIFYVTMMSEQSADDLTSI